jgi:pentatricopeptide repeat protein
VSREVDETESSTYTEEGYAEVEAGSPEEARDLVENMLRDGEYMDWEMVGDRSYGDSEITETRDEQIDNIEEV